VDGGGISGADRILEAFADQDSVVLIQDVPLADSELTSFEEQAARKNRSRFHHYYLAIVKATTPNYQNVQWVKRECTASFRETTPVNGRIVQIEQILLTQIHVDPLQSSGPKSVSSQMRCSAGHLIGGFKHVQTFFIFHNIWDNPSH